MSFITWNVRGIKGKMTEIIRELNQFQATITVLTETKKKGKGIEEIRNYIHIFSGVRKDQRAKQGVSILIAKKFKKFISNWECIDERIVKMNITIKGKRMCILGIYAPNDDDTVNNKDEFYDKLNNIITDIGTTREVILMGDFNGRTGNQKNNTIIGPFGENVTNDNGRRLINCCDQNNLKIYNGFFQHKDIHRYTWRQDTRQLKSIIDYFILKQKSKLRVLDVKAFRGPNCGSDHYLLRSKIFLPYKQESTRMEPNEQLTKRIEYPQYNISSFEHPSTKILYQQRLDNYLKDNEQLTTEELYKHINECIHRAATEAIGMNQYSQRKHNVPMWSEKVEVQTEKKKKLYLKWLSTKNDQDKLHYKEAQRETRRIVAEENRNMWDRKCSEIDNYIGGQRCSEVWRFLRNVKTPYRETTSCTIIQPQMWYEYCSRLYIEDRPQFLQNSPIRSVNIIGESVTITPEEVSKKSKLLKNGKSPGPGGISGELIKYGSSKLFRILARLFTRCINGETVPDEWKEAYITPLHKKGDRSKCDNYRTLSVTSTFSRFYGRILRDLIEDEYQTMEAEEQSGFRAGRTCTDNTFCIKQLMEKQKSVGKEAHLLFVDLSKAYDTIPVTKLWEALKQTQINHTLITAVQNLYQNSTSRVKIRKELTDCFPVTKGLRQGCCISPTLFKIYIEHALRQWKRKCGTMGFELGDTTLYTLQFADDQVIIAQSKEDLEYMTRKLIEEYEKWGLTMNTKKTKYLNIEADEEDLSLQNGIVIERCDDFKYLGVTFEREGRDSLEIQNRVTQSRKVIGALNGIFWSKNITKQRKKNIYNSMVKSILTYGSEIWTMNENDKRKILATEMDALRRSARISKLERKTNKHVREIMNADITVIEQIEQRQLIWYGHTQRMDQNRLPKKIMEWSPTGRRKRGRPRNNWGQGVRRAMSERNLSEDDWQNRREWKIGVGRRRQTL